LKKDVKYLLHSCWEKTFGKFDGSGKDRLTDGDIYTLLWQEGW
jgi:hypothetical protein